MLEKWKVAVTNLPRFVKRGILLGFDFLALAVALWLAYCLRYGIWSPPTTLDQFEVILTGPVVALPIFVRMGLYRAVIRYLPERALWTILQAMTLAALCWVALAFLSELVVHGYVPRSVPLIYWLLGMFFIAGSRFLAKAILGRSGNMERNRRSVVIYGAGEGGAQLATALGREPSTFIVGFIDDNRNLHGRDIAGFRVFPPGYLGRLISEYGVSEVILSITSLDNTRRREIVGEIGRHGIRLRTLPPLSDVAQGKYLVNRVREIDIDELLGRSSVPPDSELLRQMIEGRSIMVTGAGGSIGSELCRLIARWAPRRLVLFEANEFALYNIDRELTALGLAEVVPVLGSVTDASRAGDAIGDNGIEVVFHTAAYKHVPLVEANALEGIRNNVLGTAAVAQEALDRGVENFVLISSDKAVRPTNVMGATKRWAELIVWQKSIEAAQLGKGQRFCSVRFGNVLGSNGSVVPLFKEQIAAGGPVTLTDPAMTRYFMSIHEAAELIVQAAALSEGGDVFLLEMGNPIPIRELAENMIRLAGLSVRDRENPGGDIEIEITGKRPGEKLYEELFYDRNLAGATRHPKILRARRNEASAVDIPGSLNSLARLLTERKELAARTMLFEVIQRSAGAQDLPEALRAQAGGADASTRTSDNVG
jgi:FlaA1/EpsC-like NDP-sugar epimerase